MVQVAFQLRRRPRLEPTAAILLETSKAEAVLAFVSRLGLDRLPPLFRVPGGFLVVPPSVASAPVGGIRLRSIGPNLFLPIDADLTPALLDDEIAGLVRDRGLIFLPGGRVLGFDPKAPVSPSSLVTAGTAAGSAWKLFPSRPSRPDRIREVAIEPEEGQVEEPDAILESGGSPGDDPIEIGKEGPPRPEAAGPAKTMANRAAVEAGKGMVKLGEMLGIKGLADLGAKWIGQAVSRVPRLTEAMLGRQEGALRELLRQFREGDVEQALRHALPLGGPKTRGGVPTGDHRLPNVDPTYSLRALLGSSQGPSGIWLGGFDVQAELAREYRKAAEEAEKRGDYRRAAFIHGRLLNDYATAANLLSRAGLHHDSAILYLNKLSDVPAAAREFEAAGEVDRALRLYRSRGLHAEAGDLLHRVGELDAALEEYRRAAEHLANESGGHLAAGDLLRDRAGRPDLALEYYAVGWASRPSTSSVACAGRMIQLHADRGEAAPLMRVADQADAVFSQGQHGSLAVGFYNDLASVAEHPNLVAERDDLRDRSLMALAGMLRQASAQPGRPSQLVSTTLGRSKLWAPDAVEDATFAVKAAFELQSQRRRIAGRILGQADRHEPRRITVASGLVTAACTVASRGEVFLGFDSGEVHVVNLVQETVELVTREFAPILALSAQGEGASVAILFGVEGQPASLGYWRRGEGAKRWSGESRRIDGPGEFWLTPMISPRNFHGVGVWNGEELLQLGGCGSLAILQRFAMPFLKTEPPAALLLPARGNDPLANWTILLHDGPDICHVDAMGKLLRPRYLGWRPTLPEGHSLRAVPLASLQVASEHLDLAGLDREGVVHWSSLRINETELVRNANLLSASEGYKATTIVSQRVLAAVSSTGIDWLRCGSTAFVTTSHTPAALHDALACFPSHWSEELAVVRADGSIVCFPMPK
jgi:tetratricopeptide (TPR) repeat protein